jgi:uncharacterized protein YkwD
MSSSHLQHLARATVLLAAAYSSQAIASEPKAVAAAISPTAVSAAAPDCREAKAARAGSRAEHTIVCLINAHRRRYGLPKLRVSAQLARAARGHARDMVRHSYFDHYGPSGSSPTSRAVAEGYRGARTIAENLAYGSGDWGSPAGTVALWLGSAPHRRTLLARSLRDVGIGTASGAPQQGYPDAVTVSATFARR